MQAPLRFSPHFAIGLMVIALASPAKAQGVSEQAINDLVLRLGEPKRAAEASKALAEIGAPAVPALTKALSSVGDEVRRWAGFTLAKLGRAARPATAALVKALDDPSWRVRVAAAHALGELEPPASAVPGLRKLLAHPHRLARIAAARALKQVGAPARAAAPELIRALEDPDGDVRRCAAEALGVLPEAEEAIKPLAAAVSDAKSHVAIKAAEALSVFGARAVPELVALLRSQDPQVRKRAAYALWSIGKEAAAALEPMLVAIKDSNRAVRKFACMLLQIIGRDSPATLPALWKAVKDEDVDVRGCALGALVEFDPASERVLIAVLEALGDEHFAGRQGAVELLPRLQADSKRFAPGLRRVLKDPSWEVRCAAARACGDLDERAGPIVPALAEALSGDPVAQVRGDAAEALGSIGGTAAIRALQAALKDPDAEVRRRAAAALKSR